MSFNAITENNNIQSSHELHDYLPKLSHKTFYFNERYYSLSAYLSFHAVLSHNLKMHYFRDDYAFLRIFKIKIILMHI